MASLKLAETLIPNILKWNENLISIALMATVFSAAEAQPVDRHRHRFAYPMCSMS